MPKKAGGLTGGTGDVNPQIYRLVLPRIACTTLGATSNAASSTQQFPVPVPKYPTSSDGTAIVMEVLKIRWSNNIGFNPSVSASMVHGTTAWLTTRAPSGAPALTAAPVPFADGDSSIVDINQGSLGYQFLAGPEIMYTYRYACLSMGVFGCWCAY